MTNRWTTNGTPEDGDGYDHRSTRTTMPTQIQPLTRRVSDGSSGLGVVAGEGVAVFGVPTVMCIPVQVKGLALRNAQTG